MFCSCRFFCFICFVRNLKVLSGALFLTHLLSSLSSQSSIPNHSPFSLTLTPMASLTAFSDSIQSIFFPSHIYFTHLEHIYRVKAFYSHSSQDSLPPAHEWSSWNAWKSNSNQEGRIASKYCIEFHNLI